MGVIPEFNPYTRYGQQMMGYTQPRVSEEESPKEPKWDIPGVKEGDYLQTSDDILADRVQRAYQTRAELERTAKSLWTTYGIDVTRPDISDPRQRLASQWFYQKKANLAQELNALGLGAEYEQKLVGNDKYLLLDPQGRSYAENPNAMKFVGLSPGSEAMAKGFTGDVLPQYEAGEQAQFDARINQMAGEVTSLRNQGRNREADYLQGQIEQIVRAQNLVPKPFAPRDDFNIGRFNAIANPIGEFAELVAGVHKSFENTGKTRDGYPVFETRVHDIIGKPIGQIATKLPDGRMANIRFVPSSVVTWGTGENKKVVAKDAMGNEKELTPDNFDALAQLYFGTTGQQSDYEYAKTMWTKANPDRVGPNNMIKSSSDFMNSFLAGRETSEKKIKQETESEQPVNKAILDKAISEMGNVDSGWWNSWGRDVFGWSRFGTPKKGDEKPTSAVFTGANGITIKVEKYKDGYQLVLKKNGKELKEEDFGTGKVAKDRYDQFKNQIKNRVPFTEDGTKFIIRLLEDYQVPRMSRETGVVPVLDDKYSQIPD